MSLIAFNTHLNTTQRLAVVPMGQKHLTIGDPKTAEGRAALAAHPGLAQSAFCLSIDDTGLSGNLRVADVLMGLSLQWLISVDETGDAFVPRTPDSLFYSCHTPRGSWDAESDDVTLDLELAEDDTPFFLMEGTLYGDGITLTLRDIYTQPVFSDNWMNGAEILLLPAHPLVIVAFTAMLSSTDLTPRQRDMMVESIIMIIGKVKEDVPLKADPLGPLCDWIRDRSFQHGPNRAQALWTQEAAQALTTLIAMLPNQDQPWRELFNTEFYDLSAHSLMAVEAVKSRAVSLYTQACA